MQTVKPCPKSCAMNWTEFHNLLDIAVAHMISEAGPDTPGDEYLPSKTPVMRLIEFSHGKKMLQEKHQYGPEPEKPIDRD